MLVNHIPELEMGSLYERRWPLERGVEVALDTECPRIPRLYDDPSTSVAGDTDRIYHEPVLAVARTCRWNDPSGVHTPVVLPESVPPAFAEVATKLPGYHSMEAWTIWTVGHGRGDAVPCGYGIERHSGFAGLGG